MLFHRRPPRRNARAYTGRGRERVRSVVTKTRYFIYHIIKRAVWRARTTRLLLRAHMFNLKFLFLAFRPRFYGTTRVAAYRFPMYINSVLTAVILLPPDHTTSRCVGLVRSYRGRRLPGGGGGWENNYRRGDVRETVKLEK